MKITCDIHTHTIASGHAYGTILENAKAAAEKGLSLLGISEHAPGVQGTCDPLYFWNLVVVPRTLHGVSVIHGSEVNVWQDGTLSLEDRYLDRLDYGIVGIHLTCYEDAGREKNTENLIHCMKHPKIFFVSHPDDDNTPLDYEKLVKAAKEYHVALEVNNSSLLKPQRRLNCYENYRTMLKLCMEYQVPVILSSDAHFPTAVGGLDKSIQLLEECGFDENLVLNTSKEKVLQFIGKEDIDFTVMGLVPPKENQPEKTPGHGKSSEAEEMPGNGKSSEAEKMPENEKPSEAEKTPENEKPSEAESDE